MNEILTTQELVACAKRYIPPNYAPNDDFVLERGFGPWEWDTEGRKRLNLVGCYSALSLGHLHPAVIAALEEQLQKMTANANMFWEKEKILFAKELAEMVEEYVGMTDAQILFMSDGVDAVEAAMKIARKYGYEKKKIQDDKAELIFCNDNFHGRTLGATGASTVPEYRNGFGPFPPGMRWIPFGDAASLERAITPRTAAFFMEPIQGEGGINVPPDGYLTTVRDITRKHNVLLVADEVQTGFGRTGKMFACMRERVIPDILLLGKALGGGIPISAVAAPTDIMSVLRPGTHGSTFGGNPLACAAGRAAIKIIRDSFLENRAERLGMYFRKQLRKIAEKNRVIIDVRGRGLLVGMELRTGEGGKGQAPAFVRALAREGVLCGTARDTTLRFSPPLTITRDELDWGLSRIQKFFSA
jgi:ornithine--oxo-acid transaminase